MKVAPKDPDNLARSGVMIVAVGLAAIATLLLHVRQYPVLTHDDAFISLRYAQRFLAGEGLTWTDGAPVEGYSNFFWVISCAALGALGVDLIDTPVVVGVASSLALIAAIIYAFRPQLTSGGLPAFVGAMFVALAGPIGLWAVAGLEGCMVAALLAWSVVLLRSLLDEETPSPRAAFATGIPLALLCLTRPDGPLFAAVACAFLLLRKPSAGSMAQALRVATLPAVAVFAQLGFRLAYYGDWVPNTARAKVAFSGARVESGLVCVADAGIAATALWVPGLLALYVAYREPARRARILLVVSLLVAWTAYAATIACEPYGFRMLIPSYVLLAFLAAELFDWLLARDSVPRPALWAIAVALLSLFGWSQWNEPGIVLARTERPPITRFSAAIGQTLRDAFDETDPLLAVDAAGAIPFYSGFRSIDMLGLNDAQIARRRGDSFGAGTLGHELGDGDYVLTREPDLIVAKRLGTNRLAFDGGREIEADPRFAQHYRRVRLRGNEPVPWTFYAFVRIDGRTGIASAGPKRTIPGYLFANRRGTVGERDAKGRYGARFLEPRETTVTLDLEPGTWDLRAKGQGSFRIGARSDLGESTRTERPDVARLVLRRAAPVEVTVLGEPTAFLDAVVCERMEAGVEQEN